MADTILVQALPGDAADGDVVALPMTAHDRRRVRRVVEAPDGTRLASGGADGRFLVEIFERPKDAAGTLDLRLTLAAGERAVETAARLDTARLPR